MSDGFAGFCVGSVIFGLIGFVGFVEQINKYEGNISKACKGSHWVIEEPLIKKTLTCVVEIKESK